MILKPQGCLAPARLRLISSSSRGMLGGAGAGAARPGGGPRLRGQVQVPPSPGQTGHVTRLRLTRNVTFTSSAQIRTPDLSGYLLAIKRSLPRYFYFEVGGIPQKHL